MAPLLASIAQPNKELRTMSGSDLEKTRRRQFEALSKKLGCSPQVLEKSLLKRYEAALEGLRQERLLKRFKAMAPKAIATAVSFDEGTISRWFSNRERYHGDSPFGVSTGSRCSAVAFSRLALWFPETRGFSYPSPLKEEVFARSHLAWFIQRNLSGAPELERPRDEVVRLLGYLARTEPFQKWLNANVAEKGMKPYAINEVIRHFYLSGCRENRQFKDDEASIIRDSTEPLFVVLTPYLMTWALAFDLCQTLVPAPPYYNLNSNAL